MADVNWGDLIDHLGDDPHTRSILLYMESVGDARSFLSAAREVALTKPIIAIKVGRSGAAAKAAASHTGALTGSDDVLDAAFRRVGVLRVDTIEELFGLAELLGKQPRPAGPRLAIVTNGGGPGVLATDALIECGGKLAELSGKTFDELNKLLPPHWSRGNPVDILGDASPETYAKAVEIVARDENNDGLLVILSPQAVTEPTQTAERLRAFAKLKAKPILASWIGGVGVRPGMEILDRAGIPTFEYPDAAARAFCAMWRYSHNLDALYETPALTATAEIDRSHAEQIINRARKAQRTLLTEIESKQLLAAYGIPTVETKIAKTEEEAVELAKKIGGPVVLKIYSETITHKSDVGGVKLNLRGAAAVRRAYREIARAVAGVVRPRRRDQRSRLQQISRRNRAADDRAGWLRAYTRQQHRSPIRAGASIRHGRIFCRGFQGSRARPSAAESHTGAAANGANTNLQRAQKRFSWTRPNRSGRAGRIAGALQPVGDRTALD